MWQIHVDDWDHALHVICVQLWGGGEFYWGLGFALPKFQGTEFPAEAVKPTMT
jgi:hypothetical protein